MSDVSFRNATPDERKALQMDVVRQQRAFGLTLFPEALAELDALDAEQRFNSPEAVQARAAKKFALGEQERSRRKQTAGGVQGRQTGSLETRLSGETQPARRRGQASQELIG